MCRKVFLFLFLTLVLQEADIQAQVYSEAERLQGYAQRNDSCIFLFDQTVYQEKPVRVVATGEFRNWSTDMDDDQWQLVKSGQTWQLPVYNPEMIKIKSNSRFKFRTDDGKWIDPPSDLKTTRNNDLVYMFEKDPPRLKAEIQSNSLIWTEFELENKSMEPVDYRLTDAEGNRIPIAGILPNEAHSMIMSPGELIDKRRVYYLEYLPLELKTVCSFDGWFRRLYSTERLGAEIIDNQTTIRLFAPRADSVTLYLYKNRSGDKAFFTENMIRNEVGVWESEFEENLHGIYYDFTIHGPAEPGNMFYETHQLHVNDPYARVSDDTWGRCRIWKATKPATALKDGIPAMQDIIAYEVHVQDFTDRLPVDENIKGTFRAMHMPGLKNNRGEKIGFDYLLDLGINVLHLMPVQEYLHFPTDDWKESFGNDSYMIDQGISDENYQWGYRTSFAMAVESRYRTKGTEPGSERDEFRDLVQAFHDQGIAVIIDIVPNHTAENMDGNEWIFNFNGIDKQYYYRTKDLEHIGAYGNEVKTENRPMVQRWIIDQCLYFINEFGIDGFRIDLAGQIDKQTLKALKNAIGDDKILYGEPWIASNDPDFENNPDWDWYKEDAPITFFQDDARNAFKGPVFVMNDKEKDRGWPGGDYSHRENVIKGLSAGFPEDKTPLSGINYLDIHDNFALADQFGTEDFDGRFAVDQELYKIAAVLLYTSLGPIVTHGGSEIMRSKADAPLGEVVKETKAGYKVYMHGYRDTYNHRKANQFDWEKVGQKPTLENKNDYANMQAYWKGLNELRKSDYGTVFRIDDKPGENYYQWILPDEESLLGYVIDEKVLVLINAGDELGSFQQVELPEGSWRLVGNINTIDIDGIQDSNNGNENRMTGENQYSISLPAHSLNIWINDN